MYSKGSYVLRPGRHELVIVLSEEKNADENAADTHTKNIDGVDCQEMLGAEWR